MRIWIAALLVSFATSATGADFQPTYQATWDVIAQRADCKNVEYPDLFLFTCNEGLVLWYFTKPDNSAHPGVIKRYFVKDADGGTSIQEDARSFGSDDAQPTFKAWLASIAALDQKVRDAIAHEAQGKQQQ
jgi:hypothetical protein